ncbi:hypothetical protein LXL04_000322 [Taraxacum kok-saghyz]
MVFRRKSVATADGVNRSSRTLSNRRLTPCLPPVVNRSSRTLSNRRRRQSLTSDPQSLTGSLLVSLLSSIAHREHSATADAVNRSPATLSPSPAHSLSPSYRPSRFTPPSSARLATADNTYADSQNTYPVSSLIVSLKKYRTQLWTCGELVIHIYANSEVRMIMHRKNTMELESEWNLSEEYRGRKQPHAEEAKRADHRISAYSASNTQRLKTPDSADQSAPQS